MEQSSTIRQAMKSANLNAVIKAAIASLLLVLLVGFSVKSLYNHFAGPFEVTNKQLISFQGPQDTFHTYVTTQPRLAVNTGIYFYEVQDDNVEKILYSYYALQFDDRFLLAKYPGVSSGDIIRPKIVTGKIVRMTDKEELEVLQPLKDEDPGLDNVFLPYMLDTTGNNDSIWLSIIGIVIMFSFFIWSLVNLLQHATNPAKHPIAKEFSRYGDWQQLAQEIDAQLSEPHETHGKSFHLTRDWLVYQTKSRFDAVPYRDLIWQYMFQVTYQSFGFITGRVYSLMVCDRHGVIKNLPYGKDSAAVVNLLEKLREHAPWAYTGYSAETENTWNEGRENMIAMVDARKQAMEQASVADQEVTEESEPYDNKNRPSRLAVISSIRQKRLGK